MQSDAPFKTQKMFLKNYKVTCSCVLNSFPRNFYAISCCCRESLSWKDFSVILSSLFPPPGPLLKPFFCICMSLGFIYECRLASINWILLFYSHVFITKKQEHQSWPSLQLTLIVALDLLFQVQQPRLAWRTWCGKWYLNFMFMRGVYWERERKDNLASPFLYSLAYPNHNKVLIVY